MKFFFLMVVLLFAAGYSCSYLLRRNKKRAFLPDAVRDSIRKLGFTCFFLAAALLLLVLYFRVRH